MNEIFYLHKKIFYFVNEIFYLYKKYCSIVNKQYIQNKNLHIIKQIRNEKDLNKRKKKKSIFSGIAPSVIWVEFVTWPNYFTVVCSIRDFSSYALFSGLREFPRVCSRARLRFFPPFSCAPFILLSLFLRFVPAISISTLKYMLII